MSTFQLFDVISFTMYICRNSCEIEFENEVVITGSGQWNSFVSPSVSVYNENGWVKKLPDLNIARFLHGCGYFVNNDNKLVKWLTIHNQSLVCVEFFSLKGLSCYWWKW